MESPPDREKRKPDWMKSLRWETSPPFKVRWLAVGDVRARCVNLIRNEYNDGEAVTKGFDCQEVGPMAGKELVHYLDSHMQRLK
jgi:YTH domain-containing protein 1